MATAKDEHFLACSDWFSFHLSHLEDKRLSKLKSLWPKCEKCRVVYEGLNYTSTEGEFGLMTREILNNLDKVRTMRAIMYCNDILLIIACLGGRAENLRFIINIKEMFVIAKKIKLQQCKTVARSVNSYVTLPFP